MNKRLMIGLVIAAGVLFVAIVILFVIIRLQTPTSTTTTSTTTNSNTTTDTTTTTNTETSTDTTLVTETDEEEVVSTEGVDDITSITRLARNFTERYGSYSTDTNFANIEQTRSMMTSAMSAQADRVIAQGGNTGEFSSVESRATNVRITDFSSGATGATVEADVRQTTITGQGDPMYNNVTARLTLKKEGMAWKVDSFRWL